MHAHNETTCLLAMGVLEELGFRGKVQLLQVCGSDAAVS